MDQSGSSSFAEAERLFVARDYPAAARLLASVVEREPDHAAARSLLGLSRFRMHDYAGAEAAFAQLMEANPADHKAAYNRGLALLEQGRADDARAAFEAALRRRPDFPEAQRRLTSLQRPEARQPRSLAEMLDDRQNVSVHDGVFAGDVLWEGRPVPLVPVASLAIAVMLLWLPRLLHDVAQSLPNSPVRSLAAVLWHLAAAVGPPLALVVIAGAVLSWLNTWILIRSHRLELASGVFVRRYLVLWYHDLEQQVVVRQTFLEAALGLGTLEIASTALPRRGRRRRSLQGRVTVGSRPIVQMTSLAAAIRAAVLWERRRMIQNFITSR